jgi:D-inositol-3-phosphate glycosyltransferase
MVSVHTSPLDQPGTGDAGGMNVYVLELSRALARHGAQVEIFTRATSSAQPPSVDVEPGVRVLHIPAGPFEGLDKEDLPGQLCAFTAGMLHAEAFAPVGWYDVVHSHYWLSGQAGWLAADRWDVPLVHTMHTMARTKNAALAPGDIPEPNGRIIGEEQVVAASDALVANSADEAADLVRAYGADPDLVHVVPPGVDLDVFHPMLDGGVLDGGVLDDGVLDDGVLGGGASDGRPRSTVSAARTALRDRLGLPRAPMILFAGRIQLLKGPDVLVQALRYLPPDVRLVILGGPSGRPTAARELAALAHQLGVADRVIFRPPVGRVELAEYLRAADVVAVPSHSESCGLVAAEAQAFGTPVVAAAVGGLRSVVRDHVTGVLIDGHDPRGWADQLGRLLGDDALRARLAAGARVAGRRFGWDDTAAMMLSVYAQAAKARRQRQGDR